MKNENTEDIIFKNLIKTEKKFLKILGIKEHLTQCLNTELEVIPNKILHPDLVFDTTEEKIIHIEFQSTYNIQENYKRFCAYDSLLDLKYNKEIETIIIYTCNIKNPKKQLKRGNITYQPRIITFKNKNSDILFKNIENKIKYNQEITQEEFMELVYTIFMGGTTSLKERIKKII